jgi:hypothetical protein
MKVVLVSTYDGGHQPFGLASPAAQLRAAGADVACLDLAVQQLDVELIAAADLVAFFVPMHTATRMASNLLPQVRALNPRAHLCCYGLYAPLNAAWFRGLGVQTLLGGEFEPGLVALHARLVAGATDPAEQPEPLIALDRQPWMVPERQGLPGLMAYAQLENAGGSRRTAGYTEASRGCKHLCRHCPVVPIYGGRFRVVPRPIVLADIRQQVAAGARHITFGDPDFLNGPGHALPLVEALHQEFPDVTYDVTIKIEHLLRHANALPVLRRTGCLFVTSAVESVDEDILRRFEKHHTAADFRRAVELLREADLAFNPTFVTFTPWTTRTGYLDLLASLDELDLVENVAPVQYAIRLLIPAGSRLLELPDVEAMVGAFDHAALSYPWVHPDPAVDQLYADVRRAVQQGQSVGVGRRAIFERVVDLAERAAGPMAHDRRVLIDGGYNRRPVLIPRLSEPWFC